MAISNGKLLSDTPGPARTQHTLTFARSPKMSSYLVAMAVGDFQCLDAIEDAVPIRVCATPDQVNLGRIALEATQAILKFYNGYYAIKYPFGKLDLVAVPDFAAGAMENTAAIFFRETDLLADSNTASVSTRKNIADTIAHEMAHQWFGDLVTMAWWDDLWLNEGFATWMSSHPLEVWKPEWRVDVDEASENQEALGLDSLKSTHPIHADDREPGRDREFVRRHHLSERRGGPSHGRELRRRRDVPACHQHLPAGARVRQRDIGGPVDGSRIRVGSARRSDHADVHPTTGCSAGRDHIDRLRQPEDRNAARRSSNPGSRSMRQRRPTIGSGRFRSRI